MRVIGKLAKNSVPGRVIDAWQEEQEKVSRGYYGEEDDYYFDGGYDDDYRPPRRRSRGRRRETELPVVSRESFFGDDRRGPAQTRWSNDYDEDDDDDDFYDVDGEDYDSYKRPDKTRRDAAFGTPLTSQEQFEEAYERSKQRAPQPPQ